MSSFKLPCVTWTRYPLQAKYISKLQSKIQWGNLELPEAVRPISLTGASYLVRGYHTCAIDRHTDFPALMINETRPRIYGLFFDLIDRFQMYTNDLVDVALVSTHEIDQCKFFWATGQDAPVLKSFLADHEEYFLRDGHASIAVIHNELDIEIHLDTHKTIAIYPGSNKRRWHFVDFLRKQSLQEITKLKCMGDIEHIHFPLVSTHLQKKFLEVCKLCGADE